MVNEQLQKWKKRRRGEAKWSDRDEAEYFFLSLFILLLLEKLEISSEKLRRKIEDLEMISSKNKGS
jgi:hypothetical protein